MSVGSRWRRYLRFWRRDIASDLDDELAYHFEQRVQQFIAAGMTRRAAESKARERFGDVSRSRAEILDIDQRAARRADRASMFDALGQDLTFASRALRRSPGLAIACVVTIALGVGANGAMFTLADGLFLRPPSGVAEPAQVRRFYVRTTRSVGQITQIQSLFSYQAFATLDSGLAARAQLAAFTKADSIPFRVGDDEPNRNVYGSYVTGDYMSILGVQAEIGRFFASDEAEMGQPKLIAVISHRLWEREFGGDERVIGKTVSLNRQRMMIIGVAPRGFGGTDLSSTDVWMPLPTFPAPAEGTWYKHYAGWRVLRIIGRIVPDTRDEWLANAATTIVRRDVRDARSRTNVMRDSAAAILTGPILESLGPTIAPPPEIAIATRLVGVTLIVLLIACANVASLLLARAMTRRREIAVRLALGMSRRRLMTQLAIEGVVLAVLASAAALLLSAWAGAALRVLVLPDTHWTQPLLDARVTAFTLLVAIVAGVVAGLVPALQASTPQLTSALKSGSRDGVTGASRSRARTSLLVAQIALSVVLLYGAGLFVRSLSHVRGIDLGVDPERLVYATAWMASNDTPYLDYFERETEAVTIARLQEIASELRSRPDVEGVAMSTNPPMAGYSMVGVYLADGREVPQLDNRDPGWIGVTPSYFATTDIALSRGRAFTDADRGTRVAVVNETAARAYWPNADPIGQCLRLFRDTLPCTTVVGVMKGAHLDDVIEKPTAQIVSLASVSATGAPNGTRYLVVRTAPGRADQVVQFLRAEVRRTFPPSSAIMVTSMADVIAPQLRPWRLGATIFSAFGLLALVVAALGTYSVIAYSVNQRAHEMSVRAALGARAADVVGLIVGQGVRIAGVGIVLGVAVSVAASRLIASLLYETSARDPLVGLAVAALLALVAVIASSIPAWRATRADPVEALRSD
jgi:predicted permease